MIALLQIFTFVSNSPEKIKQEYVIYFKTGLSLASINALTYFIRVIFASVDRQLNTISKTIHQIFN